MTRPWTSSKCLREVLASHLPEYLFGGIGGIPDQRRHLYGDGHEDLDRAYERLQRELMILEMTGHGSVRMFAEGERALRVLIEGVTVQESGQKRLINPDRAVEEAEADRFLRAELRGEPLPSTPPTIDQVEQAQADAVYGYQRARYFRLFLEDVLKAVQGIRRGLEPPGLDQGHSGRTS